ncbi:glycosyltransferase [Vibrio brasiliensis]|uniref:Group 1 glycosyl transferase n=1 Tax=Vibrio brasiliensis LMG 20546 TaxID=945543 RepID=E8LWU4_9VIBR|nr:glycosyltransferase [Vibrio brasiliensis]EGA64845.1 group 1 glycosyl transferase [Vibrio brasiliensis LMG 20546]MCG9649385.1 glycosyltransferase [Vibrio brasiliensis]
MCVAYIVKRYPRYSETFIVNEILAHEKAGLEVHIFALLPPQDSHFQDIIAKVRAPVTYLPAKADRASTFWERQKKAARWYPETWQVLGRYPNASVREVLQALELSLYIGRMQITHLHAHFATTSTTVAQIASAITRVPFSFTAHAKDIFHQDNDFAALATKFEQAKRAITVSDFNYRYLTQELSVNREKVVKIYNGLDLDQFPYCSPEQREPMICAIGRLVEKKGFCDLITACQHLKLQGMNFQCEIIGDGELKHELQQQINALELQEIVTLKGSLPQQEIKQHLRQAAVFAAPCVVGEDGNRDGLPTVLLESMALGTPCVSTDVTGIPEVILDGQTGLMVEQRNPKSLAGALERLLKQTQLRISLSQQARLLIESQFNIHTNAKKIRAQFRFI